MKAIDILKAADDAGLLVDGGTVNYTDIVTLQELIGAKEDAPEIEHSRYFYLYAEDWKESMPHMAEPDACIETKYSGKVWLWKIEN